MILAGSLWIRESVVTTAHVVFEGGGTIGQVVWLGDILQERLLGMPEIWMVDQYYSQYSKCTSFL